MGHHTWFMEYWRLSLGFVHIKQVLYWLSHIPNPTLIFLRVSLELVRI